MNVSLFSRRTCPVPMELREMRGDSAEDPGGQRLWRLSLRLSVCRDGIRAPVCVLLDLVCI